MNLVPNSESNAYYDEYALYTLILEITIDIITKIRNTIGFGIG